MVQFGVVDKHQTTAVEAVNNLRRRLLPGRGRSRRNTDTEAWLLRSTLDNRTITPTGIYSWTGNLRYRLLRPPRVSTDVTQRRRDDNLQVI